MVDVYFARIDCQLTIHSLSPIYEVMARTLAISVFLISMFMFVGAGIGMSATAQTTEKMSVQMLMCDDCEDPDASHISDAACGSFCAFPSSLLISNTIKEHSHQSEIQEFENVSLVLPNRALMPEPHPPK